MWIVRISYVESYCADQSTPSHAHLSFVKCLQSHVFGKGIPHHRARKTKAEESYAFPFVVTHVSGLFCNASAKYTQEPGPLSGTGFPLTPTVGKASFWGDRLTYSLLRA